MIEGLDRRIIIWFRQLTDREPMEVKLPPQARIKRIASKGLFHARLDQPPVPRGRRVGKRVLKEGPVITVAFYGPDDRQATKVVLSIVKNSGSDSDPMIRLFATDVLEDLKVLEDSRAFLAAHKAPAITMTAGTVGCPHEEGVDFPLRGDCPKCPFWKGRQGSRIEE